MDMCQHDRRPGTVLVFGYVLLPLRLDGASMEPTYRDGSWTLVNTLAFRFREPARGDVVALRLAGPSYVYLKRVVGLPGERVAFVDGRLLVDGRPLVEPYVTEPCTWNRPPVVVGPDELFVVGDNRSNPLTHHAHGCVARARLAGGVLW